MTPARQLTLFDSVCLIVGIVVGAGIYQVPPDVARGAGSGPNVLILWLAGGLLSLLGALGYAELATAWPQAGGDYAYLTRAYGRWAGFLFGWIQLAIVRPGDIAVMAFAYATYACAIYDPPLGPRLHACLAILTLSAVNILGVQQSKWTQNLLAVAKMLGLVAIVGVALLAPRAHAVPRIIEPLPVSLALILILFTLGGWNEMAYVAAEVVHPQRNIVRALALGTASVTALYLVVNAGFLYTLGYDRLATSRAVAADAIAAVFPARASVLISTLVCLSALGAVNGLIFTGARITYAVGRDHPLLGPFGHWNPKTGTPVRALVLQGIISIVMVLWLGNFLNTILYTAAPVYLFLLATSVSIFVLRRTEPHTPRPYRVPGYPATTVVFCVVCALLAYSAIAYRPWVALAALGILLAGVPLYGLSNALGRTRGPLAPAGPND